VWAFQRRTQLAAKLDPFDSLEKHLKNGEKLDFSLSNDKTLLLTFSDQQFLV